MSRWFFAWQREADFQRPWEDVFSMFDFAEEVSREETRACYKSSRRRLLFKWRYEWEVGPGEEGVEVVEKAYVSRTWFLATFLSLVGCLVSFVAGIRVEGLNNLLLLAACAVLFPVFASLMIHVFRYESPVTEEFHGQPSQDIYQPFVSLLLVNLPLFLLVLFTEGSIQLLGLIGIASLFLCYYSFQEIVEEYSLWWQRGFVESAKLVPVITSSYIVFLLSGVLPLLGFVFMTEIPVFYALVDAFPVGTSVVYIVLVLGSLNLSLLGLGQRNQADRTIFKDSGERITGRRVLAVSALVVLGVSLGFGFLSYLFVRRSIHFLSIFPDLFGVAIVAVSALPAVFLLAGFCYQLWSFVSGTISLWRRLEKQESLVSYQTKAPVYVLDYEGYFAGASSVIWKDFIVVSEGLVKKCSPGELDAIVAHEEAHIVNGDSKLAASTALLSPLVLVGRNVVYAILDYRVRETQADDYAVERTSREQLKNALERLQSLKVEEKIGERERFEEVTPTMTSIREAEEPDSFFTRYFDSFFGNYAVSEVHLSITDRLDRLR
jgi:Zn-dependent protease with chaperone function